MLTLAPSAWNIALRTAAVYLVILVGLRLSGKREVTNPGIHLIREENTWPIAPQSKGGSRGPGD